MDVLFLGSDVRAKCAVTSALPSGTRCVQVAHSAEAFRLLTARRPPSAFVIDSPSLDQRCADGVSALAGRGLLIPTALFFVRADALLFDRAWCLARLEVERLFDNRDLSVRLDHLLAGGRRALSSYLLARIQPGGDIGRKLLGRLAKDASATSLNPADLSDAFACSRSALYKILRREGMPPVGSVQLVFRFLQAQRVLAAGASIADSAHIAGYSETKTFRDGLDSHLGWTANDLAKAGWRQLADRWLERSMRPAAAPGVDGRSRIVDADRWTKPLTAPDS